MEAIADPRFLGAIGLMVLLTIAPGPDMALVTTTALLRGRGAAIRTALGISTGTLVWATLSGLGVAALLAASAEAYTVVRLAGAAYLGYLGIWAVVEAVRDRGGPADPDDVAQPVGRPYRQGLFTNLLNPKVGVFYVALLPQFLPAGSNPLAVGLLLAGVHALISVVWFAALITLAFALDRRLRRPGTVRAIDGITGTTLIGFGVRLAVIR